MKKNLVFTTNNAHKLEEIRAILGDKINILSLNDPWRQNKYLKSE